MQKLMRKPINLVQAFRVETCFFGSGSGFGLKIAYVRLPLDFSGSNFGSYHETALAVRRNPVV